MVTIVNKYTKKLKIVLMLFCTVQPRVICSKSPTFNATVILNSKKKKHLFYPNSTDVDLLDNVTHLTFVEELLDVNTTFACEKLFDYVEKRKSKITVVRINCVIKVTIG